MQVAGKPACAGISSGALALARFVGLEVTKGNDFLT